MTTLQRSGNISPPRRWTAPGATRQLTPAQIDGIRAVMQLFVADDLANGVSTDKRILCDGCQQPRPAPGVVHYDRYLLCNGCATEYEVGRARGLALTGGQFVRDKAFGEAGIYALPPPAAPELFSRRPIP